MTKKADHIGTLLAAIAAVAVTGAVIAGFMAVGGPGEARAKRLDGAILQDMVQIASTAQCAFDVTRKAPATVDALRSADLGSGTSLSSCEQMRRLTPPDYTNVAYRALGNDRIELCATFATTITQDNMPPTIMGPGVGNFPELSAPHPVGRHCYAIQLHKQAEHTDAGE